MSFTSNLTTTTTNNNTAPSAFASCWQNQSLTNFNTSLGIFILLLSIISIISNLLICMVYRRGFSRSNQNLLIVCLAIADLLNAVVVMPLEATSHLTYRWEEYYLTPGGIVFENAFYYMGQTLSVYCLLLMTLERFISIRFPFYHLNRWYVLGAVVLVCVFSVKTLFFYYFLQQWPTERVYDFKMPDSAEVLGLCLNFVLPTFVNVALYGYIFKVVRQQNKRIRSLSVVASSLNKKQQLKKTDGLQRSRNRVYVYVMAMFCILWIPFCFFNIYTFINTPFYFTCVGESLDSLFTALAFVNNAGNALIYTTSSSKFRQSLKKMLNCQNPNFEESHYLESTESNRRITRIGDSQMK